MGIVVAAVLSGSPNVEGCPVVMVWLWFCKSSADLALASGPFGSESGRCPSLTDMLEGVSQRDPRVGLGVTRG